MVYKNQCKIYVKTNLNKNLTDKNKAYRKNTQLLRIMKERLLTYIPLYNNNNNSNNNNNNNNNDNNSNNNKLINK